MDAFRLLSGRCILSAERMNPLPTEMPEAYDLPPNTVV